MRHNYKRLFPKRLYHRFDILRKYRPIAFEILQQKYEAKLLESPSDIEAAKKLHAETYLRHGYITQNDVREGIMHSTSDPYQFHAHYFGVIDRENGEVVAVARQIYNKGSAKLPVFKHILLYKTYSHIHPSQTVEISAFVKKKGVDSRALLLLFHTMLQHSKLEKHSYWLIACDTYIYSRLKTLFGPVLKKIGPKTFYMGSMVIPAEINIDKVPRYLKLGYQLSLPPLRQLRRFLFSSFTNPIEKKRM